MNLPESLRQFGEVLTDSYFVVDRDRNIVEFNRAFYSMFPRGVGRVLKSKKCYEVLQLSVCQERCIAQACWACKGPVRLDEIKGTVEGQEDEMVFILSAIPIHDERGEIIGAMEVQRNITDESAVQAKYRQQVDASDVELAELRVALGDRSRRVIELSRELARAQEALLKARTNLFG